MKPLLGLRGETDLEGMVELTNKAKKAGFWGVALPEDLELCTPDALLTIAALSQRCPDAAFMTNVINQFSRHPVALAASTMSCIDLLGDKFILGLGPGSPSTSGALGLDSKAKPLARLKEVVEIIRHVTGSAGSSGTGTSFSGKYFSIHGVTSMRARNYSPRIFIPGIQDKALRFAGTYGDGIAFSNFSSLAYLKHARTILADVKPVNELEASCTVTFIPTSDIAEGVRKYARPFAERYLSFPGIGETLLRHSGFDPSISSEIRKGAYDRLTNEVIEAMAVIGSRDNLIDRMQSMEDFGVKYPIVATDPIFLDSLLADRIM